MEDAEHHIRYVAYRLYAGDAPPNVFQFLLNQGIPSDIAFLLFTAGKILYEKQ